MRTMSGGPCLHYDCSNRNSFGYCKATVCINEHYQQEQWSLPSTTNKSDSVVIKPPTNGGSIRSMTDEELAEFMFRTFGRPAWCLDNNCPPEESCVQCWLEWLKQESENLNDKAD